MEIEELRIKLVNKYCDAAYHESDMKPFDHLLEEISLLDQLMYREFGLTLNFDTGNYE